MMGSNSLLILDKEIIKDILTAPASKDDCRFKKPIFVLPSIIGYGLVTLEGEEWAKHRRIITPAFGLSYLKDANISIFYTTVTSFGCGLKIVTKYSQDYQKKLRLRRLTFNF
jgi:hypothetical protein